MRAGRAAFMRQIDRDYRRRIAEAVEDFCTIVTTEAAQARIRTFVKKPLRKRTGRNSAR
jgi:enoyl-CoA hydratase